MKITSYRDLKPGDAWLGMTVSSRQHDSVVFPTVLGAHWIMNSSVQALIDAGNDEVERAPEEVTFEHTVVSVSACGAIIRADLAPFIGKTVEVTVKVKK